MLMLGDVGVLLPELGALVGGIADTSSVLLTPIAVTSHAGDGTYPLLAFDPTDAEQRVRAETAYGEGWTSRSPSEAQIRANTGSGAPERPGSPHTSARTRWR